MVIDVFILDFKILEVYNENFIDEKKEALLIKNYYKLMMSEILIVALVDNYRNNRTRIIYMYSVVKIIRVI